MRGYQRSAAKDSMAMVPLTAIAAWPLLATKGMPMAQAVLCSATTHKVIFRSLRARSSWFAANAMSV